MKLAIGFGVAALIFGSLRKREHDRVVAAARAEQDAVAEQEARLLESGNPGGTIAEGVDTADVVATFTNLGEVVDCEERLPWWRRR